MNKFILLSLALLIGVSSFGQHIENINVTSTNKEVTLAFDLEGDDSKVYDIDVYLSKDNGQTFLPALKYLSGDFKNATTGYNEIIWDAAKEVVTYSGPAVFKIVATPSGLVMPPSVSNKWIQVSLTKVTKVNNLIKVEFEVYPLFDCEVSFSHQRDWTYIIDGEGNQASVKSGNIGITSVGQMKKFIAGVLAKGSATFESTSNAGKIPHLNLSFATYNGNVYPVDDDRNFVFKNLPISK